MTTRIEDEEDKEDKDDKDEEGQGTDSENKAVRILAAEIAATAEATAAGAANAAASVIDITRDAAASLTSQFSNNDNLCSVHVVELTMTGVGVVRGTPGADGEGTGKAEAPCLHSSAGDD
jgi:hypothetical protein